MAEPLWSGETREVPDYLPGGLRPAGPRSQPVVPILGVPPDTKVVVLRADDYEKLSQAAGELFEMCGRCGHPPKGFATVNDVRYCHGNLQESPTCYEQACSDIASHGLEPNGRPVVPMPLEDEDGAHQDWKAQQ